MLLKKILVCHHLLLLHFMNIIKNETQLKERLRMDAANIQCVVAAKDIIENTIGFGTNSMSASWEIIPDNVDT